MSQPTKPASAPGLDAGDILFILFRQKWKILAVSTLGILGTVALFLFYPVPYRSEARLFIKYVVDTKAPVQGSPTDSRIGLPTERTGANVINTEIEILTSLDVSLKTAAALPHEVLVKLGGGTSTNHLGGGTSTNLASAAGVILKNLLLEVAPQSDVIHVVFKHKDPSVVQPVLRQLIDTYLERHGEIHRAVGAFEKYVSAERDEHQRHLAQTEEALRKAKRAVGIFSQVEDSKKSYSEKLYRLSQDIMDTRANLAQGEAEVSAMSKLVPSSVPATAGSLAASNFSGTNLAAVPAPAPVPAEKVDEYRRICGLLESLSKKDQEYASQFTAETPWVKDLREQIAAARQERKKLEDQYPGLLSGNTPDVRILAPAAERPGPSPAQMNLVAEMAKVPGLEQRLRVLTNQLQTVRKEADAVADAEGSITALERQRQREENDYNFLTKSLEELVADEQLGASRNSNISTIQNPSPPVRDAAKLMKTLKMLLGGSIAGAFALAFVIELYLDPSLKRPIEVERRLHLPLFLSIPRLRLSKKVNRPALTARPPAALLPETSADSAAPGREIPDLTPAAHASAPILAWDPRHALRPYQDALRDRLITHFEQRKLTHNPKLVALTSCGGGCGVSTVAAGLAASFSETGQGNVLLVDMHDHGSAQHFYRGNPACGLEDVLDPQGRGTALVREYLYVVRERQGGGEAPRLLPEHFQHLVSKLKTSDYDYVIFDMPPISQISVTSRLARFMDINLVVAEAEETGRERVKRASAYLAQSGASVGVVLNKTRAYGPKSLQQEL